MELDVHITKEWVTEPQSGIACEVALHRVGNPAKAAICCVHGLTRNAKDFYYLAEQLAENYYLIMPDIPGRGESPNLPSPELYNNAFYAGIIAQLLDQQQQKNIRWIGTSMGGIIGMILAALRKDLIGSMLLNDIGNIMPAAALERIKAYVGVDTTHKDYQTLAAQAQANLAPFGIESPEQRKHFVESSIAKCKRDGWRMNYDPDIRIPFTQWGEGDVDLSDLWNLITCPILLLRGEHSDLLPKQIALDMVSSKNNIELFEVANTGHAPSLTTAREVEIVKTWLNTPTA